MDTLFVETYEIKYKPYVDVLALLETLAFALLITLPVL
jgi:hypothetical protein